MFWNQLVLEPASWSYLFSQFSKEFLPSNPGPPEGTGTRDFYYWFQKMCFFEGGLVQQTLSVSRINSRAKWKGCELRRHKNKLNFSKSH